MLVVSRLRTPELGQARPSFKYEFPRYVQLREGIHQQKKKSLPLITLVSFLKEVLSDIDLSPI